MRTGPFGSSLKGILPTCPSLRSAPPPRVEKQFRSSQNKRNYMPTKNTQPATPAKNSETANLPLKTIRLGRLKATVWENGNEKAKFHNVTFLRTYKDEQDKYHDTDSFGRDDLLALAKLADQAHSFIYERLAELKTENGG
jgi:hypothetical protein